jgi:hypothetical protein
MEDPKNPAKPSGGGAFLASLLKNAKATPRHEAAKAGLETRFCANCGGNRAEGSDLTKCEFCGASFVEPKPTCAKCGAVRAKGSDPGKCEFCGAPTEP